MWKLLCTTACHDSSSPMVKSLSKDLFSLNNHVGRHVWEFDPKAGSDEERLAVEKARVYFERHRFTNQHSSDELLRVQMDAARSIRGRQITVSPPKKSDYDAGDDKSKQSPVPRALVDQATRAGIDFYQGLQDADGHWASDYGGPMFLLPGLIISLYVIGKLDQTLDSHQQFEMRRYLRNHQNTDGGYGLHIEGRSTMFGTVLSYVALRLLGVGVDGVDPLSKEKHDCVINAKSWIISRGGAVTVPSWGKFYLCVLGCYGWEGLNPIPPEAWLLPYKGNPLHPGRFWCHCRMVYLPMSYLYGKRATGEVTQLVLDLREELYVPEAPYGRINWDKTRNACAKEDLYYPHPWLQDLLWWGLTRVEPFLLKSWFGKKLRKWACGVAARHVEYEDENTRYVDIGPVNKAMNMLVAWHEAGEKEAGEGVGAMSKARDSKTQPPNTTPLRVAKHLPRVYDYLWLAEDGMKMQGYNGSQLWDCAFATQAIIATGLGGEYSDCLQSANKYIRDTQVLDDAPGDLTNGNTNSWYRHISKGAWPFSTRDHGWPISDCSSEGLKAALKLEALGEEVSGQSVPIDRLRDCVNVILSYQNSGSGGWATYENTRSYTWVEIINPAETFGDIMIDYPYVECSSASLQALAAFKKRYPNDPKVPLINKSARRGRNFLKSIQRNDGSWYGSWAVCFTYGTWFGVKGLLATGSTYDTCPNLRKAVDFLLSKQMRNGGWGESYLSCQNKTYVQLTDLQGSVSQGTPIDHIVNTAWAVLALVASGQAERDSAPLHAAARAMMRQQLKNGDFPQQTIMGVFNNNCMITYANYRNIFPVWALGEYARAVHGEGVSKRVEDIVGNGTKDKGTARQKIETKPSGTGKPPVVPAVGSPSGGSPSAGSPSIIQRALKKPSSLGSLSAHALSDASGVSSGVSSGGESPYTSDGGGSASGRKPKKSNSQKVRTSSKKKKGKK